MHQWVQDYLECQIRQKIFLLGILNSRTALTDVIKKFNLMEYYEIDDNNIDKVIKAFRGDISTDPNEFGMIDFSIINKDPKV